MCPENVSGVPLMAADLKTMMMCPDCETNPTFYLVKEAQRGIIQVCRECVRHYMCEACFDEHKSWVLPKTHICAHSEQRRFEWLMLIKFNRALNRVLTDQWIFPSRALSRAMLAEREALRRMLYCKEEESEEEFEGESKGDTSKDTQMSADQD